jgi:omega-hydroxy-beta-dihydromenaquinone-9 sulfotransferase
MKLKHQWSLGHNYLAGITAGDWWRLLAANHFAVDPAYWHRAAFITASSVINSFYRWREKRCFGPAIAKVEITKPPLFILGHWRSGTTHLHNLLALDTDQFAFANTYQVVNPHTFLTTEEANTRRFAFLVPNKRPMDNMALSFQTPQEDEFALLLGCFHSLYLGITFPRRETAYSKYLTFRGVSVDEIAEWKAAFLEFAKKLTFKYDRMLLFKSPPHTARIKLLLELFPEARFVHIHREPYTVFRSTQHFFDTAIWYTYLQRPNRALVDSGIVDRYTLLYDAFFQERGLIPAGRYHEMSFEELERHPIEQMRVLYERLGLANFERVESKMRAYLDSLTGYKKNEFGELPPPLKDAVAKAWRRSFEEWGYAL